MWKFEIEEYDIDFNVVFVPEETVEDVKSLSVSCNFESRNCSTIQWIHQKIRYGGSTTAPESIQGRYTCTETGTATLCWDNTYSRIRGKNISYLAEVVEEETMNSALLAADAMAEALSTRKGHDVVIDSSSLVPPSSSSSLSLNPAAYSQLVEECGIMAGAVVAGTGSWLVNRAASTIFPSNNPALLHNDTVGMSSKLRHELTQLNTQLFERVVRDHAPLT